jgi:cell division septation protein DedD
MPKIEPVYEPRESRESDGIFDADDDYGEEDEGSRLPLLIVIGLLVLAAFGGVVWLAYQHGLQNGMREAPRLIAGQPPSSDQQAYDKIYQKPAPSDEDTANDDTAPPPPTPTFKPQAPTPAPSANTAATAAPSTATPVPSTPAPSAPVKSTQTAAAKPIAPPPVPQSIQPQATKPPAKLVPDTASTTTAETKPVTPPPSIPAPSTPAETVPAASGDFVLQIGAYKSEDEASSSWKSYKAKHSIAGGYPESIKQVDLGAKGTWYRLRIGGFASKDAATAFCTKLKADGGDCIPAKN